MNASTRVLVVEDDLHISNLITMLLEDAGYEARIATTGASAIELLAAETIDIVILDWMLPDVPGDQVCRRIKENSDALFLPVLMLTARGTLADRIAGLDAGADDYLTKPFHNDELLARLRALLRIRRAEMAQSETLAALEEQHQKLKHAYEQLRSAQIQLIQSSKMAALGELVAGVAHELNNPLAIILGNAELLPELSNEDDRRAVQQIIAATQRGRRVVQSLVTFARYDKVEFDWHNPADLIERVLDLRRSTFRTSDIALHVTYDADVPRIWADGPQIQQVLLNLLINAEQALCDRAAAMLQIDVYSAEMPIEKPGVLPHLRRATKRGTGDLHVVIDVADNGPGLSPPVLERLFEPFVTTRPVGQGSGMSLAIANAIITQHQGSILVGSQPNLGATFRLVLPLQPAPAKTVVLPTTPQSAIRVLVIDDEPAIADLIQRLLTRSGYQVNSVLSASAGLNMLHTQPFDVILCDMRMPDIDGRTFYHQLRSERPDLSKRVVIVTGDTSNMYTDAFLKEYGLPMLRKPFTLSELLQAVDTIASAPSTQVVSQP